MIKSNYDKIEHKCKVCGTLMTEDYFTNHHTAGDCLRDKVHREDRIKPVKVKTLYEVGEEVEATLFGKIISTNVTDTGKVYYKILNEETGETGTFLEKRIMELLEPDDFEPEQYNEDGGEDR